MFVSSNTRTDESGRREYLQARGGRADLPPVQEGTPMESEAVVKKPRPPSNRMILPSISAPEHNILKLLEECNASSI
ncbi:hypothetical protein Acr_20g0005280 [Actinidia rufa]|uniref:Uncharacterized protein n=1 Tax=Actinidia rufa TaxID=165716 RepID=A0A7J0GD41_9ERIC|nr:hypothetical protein Acr_20g0005280 [Actinidia rufa]